MRVIPVIDLLGGQVVRAVAGERAAYRPVESRLTATATPSAVATAMLDLAPFSSFYLADLDAITGAGQDCNQARLLELCATLARRDVAELWLDAGTAPWRRDFVAGAGERGLQVVLVDGSESLSTDQDVAPDRILSLDYRRGRFLGPASLESDTAAWPARLIVMDLAAVGVGQGPSLARLDHLTTQARAAGRTDISFHAAGGVRGVDDLHILAARGVGGVLVASALHDGRLDAAALSDFLN